MITFLHGKLVEALPTQVTVDVNGVGYEALIPLSSYDKLPAPGQEFKLLTHLAVREDAHVLYGFMSAAERDLFAQIGDFAFELLAFFDQLGDARRKFDWRNLKGFDRRF